MFVLDTTQELLVTHLQETERIMNGLLRKKPYCGDATIVPNLDLGFPHDVIRLAGGFATGLYIKWNSLIPFVPVDICMNTCTVSFYELLDANPSFFSEEACLRLLRNLDNSCYTANFHRGNHFIGYMESVRTGKKYIVIHSSAAEFETTFNGLYPVEGNYIYENTRVYSSKGRYVRYIEGHAAELYQKVASHLYVFNEDRHNFFVSALLGNEKKIVSESHYHHYGMPSPHEGLLGSHMVSRGQISPLLTRPGENIFLIRYADCLYHNLCVENMIITPHGLGKRHNGNAALRINAQKGLLKLDDIEYQIQYGESLRAHPNLELRSIALSDYFSFFSKVYEYEIVDEFKQLSSYSKAGFVKWHI